MTREEIKEQVDLLMKGLCNTDKRKLLADYEVNSYRGTLDKYLKDNFGIELEGKDFIEFKILLYNSLIEFENERRI